MDRRIVFAVLLAVCVSACVNSVTNAPKQQKKVYLFYSPFCSHCREVEPYVHNLSEAYEDVEFVFCNVNNCSDECKAVMKNVTLVGVPTVVIMGNETVVLVGSTEIKEKLGELLNES